MKLVVVEWYSSRSRREQHMLLLLLAIAVLLLAWLLIVRPIDLAYDAALDRHLQAIDRNGRVRALADAAKTRPATGQPSSVGGPELALVVAEAASRAGLALDTNTASGANSVTFSIAEARPTIAAQWLRDFDSRGVSVEEFRMTPAANGTISLTARLERRRR